MFLTARRLCVGGCVVYELRVQWHRECGDRQVSSVQEEYVESAVTHDFIMSKDYALTLWEAL